MNSTASSGGFLGSNNIGGFGYGIGLSVGILLLITTITLASYFCTRVQITPPSSGTNRMIMLEPPHPQHISLEVGLDKETLNSYPKLRYSEAKLVNNKDSTATCCSICLGDYKGSETCSGYFQIVDICFISSVSILGCNPIPLVRFVERLHFQRHSRLLWLRLFHWQQEGILDSNSFLRWFFLVVKEAL